MIGLAASPGTEVVAEVLDPQRPIAESSSDPRCLTVDEPGPLWVVLGEDDRAGQRRQLSDRRDAATIVIALWVAEKLAGETIEAVVDEIRAAVLRNLKGRQGRHRKVKIVNPRGGKPFATVKVPND